MVFGRRGTGKTDFSLLIAEILHEMGMTRHFATNIKIYGSPFEIEFIDNLEDLRYWCQSRRGKKLFILDEVGKSFPRRTPMAKLNVEMIKQLQTMRKYKLSILFNTIDPRYADGAFMGATLLDGVFTKPGHKMSKNVLYDDLLEDFHLEFYGIPRTSVKFDTWDSADFSLRKKPTKALLKDEIAKRFWEYAYEDKKIAEIWPYRQTYKRELKKFLKEALRLMVTSNKTESRG